MTPKHEVEIIFGNWINLTGIKTTTHTKYQAEEHPDGTITLTPQTNIHARLQDTWNPYNAGTDNQPPIPDNI